MYGRADMADERDSDEIVLKRSGKRAKLEITIEDLVDRRLVIEDDDPAPPARSVPPTTVVPAREGRAQSAPPTAESSSPSPAPTRPRQSPPTHPTPRPRTMVHGGTTPPGSRPPTRYIHDDGAPKWWQSRSASVVAAVVLALAVVAAVLVVVTHDDGSKGEVATTLTGTKTIVKSASDSVQRVTRLKSLQRAGGGVSAQLALLDDPRMNLENRSQRNEGVYKPAIALVASETAYLQALGQLHRVSCRLIDKDFNAWRTIRARIDDAAGRVVAASVAVENLDLGDASGGATLVEADLKPALLHAEELVSSNRSLIVGWRKRRTRFRASLRAASRRAAPAREYRETVAAELADIAELRAAVTAWSRGAASVKRADADELATRVTGFQTDFAREAALLEDALKSTPDVPSSVRREHKALGLALSELDDALLQAQTAIGEFASDASRADITDTTAWGEFTRLLGEADRDAAAKRELWDARARRWIGELATPTRAKAGSNPCR